MHAITRELSSHDAQSTHSPSLSSSFVAFDSPTLSAHELAAAAASSADANDDEDDDDDADADRDADPDADDEPSDDDAAALEAAANESPLLSSALNGAGSSPPPYDDATMYSLALGDNTDYGRVYDTDDNASFVVKQESGLRSHAIVTPTTLPMSPPLDNINTNDTKKVNSDELGPGDIMYDSYYRHYFEYYQAFYRKDPAAARTAIKPPNETHKVNDAAIINAAAVKAAHHYTRHYVNANNSNRQDTKTETVTSASSALTSTTNGTSKATSAPFDPYTPFYSKCPCPLCNNTTSSTSSNPRITFLRNFFHPKSDSNSAPFNYPYECPCEDCEQTTANTSPLSTSSTSPLVLSNSPSIPTLSAPNHKHTVTEPFCPCAVCSAFFAPQPGCTCSHCNKQTSATSDTTDTKNVKAKSAPPSSVSTRPLPPPESVATLLSTAQSFLSISPSYSPLTGSHMMDISPSNASRKRRRSTSVKEEEMDLDKEEALKSMITLGTPPPLSPLIAAVTASGALHLPQRMQPSLTVNGSLPGLSPQLPGLAHHRGSILSLPGFSPAFPSLSPRTSISPHPSPPLSSLTASVFSAPYARTQRNSFVRDVTTTTSTNGALTTNSHSTSATPASPSFSFFNTASQPSNDSSSAILSSSLSSLRSNKFGIFNTILDSQHSSTNNSHTTSPLFSSLPSPSLSVSSRLSDALRDECKDDGNKNRPPFTSLNTFLHHNGSSGGGKLDDSVGSINGRSLLDEDGSDKAGELSDGGVDGLGLHTKRRSSIGHILSHDLTGNALMHPRHRPSITLPSIPPIAEVNELDETSRHSYLDESSHHAHMLDIDDDDNDGLDDDDEGDDAHAISSEMEVEASDSMLLLHSPSLNSLSPPMNAQTTSLSELGVSCHQCKSRRAQSSLTYCRHSKLIPPPCKKKYCAACIRKFYPEEIITDRQRADREWECFACREVCTCAACRRGK